MQEASRHELLGNLKPYQGHKTLLVKYQDTNDIIKALQDAHQRNAGEYDKICARFWNGNKKALLKRLFNFCKKNIAYQIESDKNQTIKTPGAILAQGHGDCKHYASFINGVISACNRKYGCSIDNYFRFSGYKIGATEPQHVFAVVKTNDGEEIWIDPVLQNFNEHKETTFKTDKKANTMALHSVSGFELAEIGKGGRGIKKWRNFKNKVSQGVKKYALVAPRNAFLALVKLNALQLAVKLGKLWKQPNGADKVTKLWNKFGGKDSAIKNAINAGLRHYRHRHHVKMDLISGFEYDKQILGEIGFEPASTAALIATATPLIIEFVKLLKGNNVTDANSVPQETAPIMTEDEGQTIEYVVNGCIGAVVRRHRATRRVKILSAKAKATASELKKQLNLPKNATAVNVLKQLTTKQLTPQQKLLAQNLSDGLTQLKTATTQSGPTSIYDRPGANANLVPYNAFDRPGATNYNPTYGVTAQQQFLAQQEAARLAEQAKQAAQTALTQGASPLVQYAAHAASMEDQEAPEADKGENMTPEEVTEATSSAGMDNKKLFLFVGGAAAIYFLTKKGKN